MPLNAKVILMENSFYSTNLFFLMNFPFRFTVTILRFKKMPQCHNLIKPLSNICRVCCAHITRCLSTSYKPPQIYIDKLHKNKPIAVYLSRPATFRHLLSGRAVLLKGVWHEIFVFLFPWPMSIPWGKTPFNRQIISPLKVLEKLNTHEDVVEEELVHVLVEILPEIAAQTMSNH